MELRRSSPSPVVAGAGEWIPLRRHPVFSSAVPPSSDHPTNLLTWDSAASRLYLWDAAKSALHRLSLRFGDDPHDPDSIEAAAATKILFPDVTLRISVLNVSVNRAGTCVAICGVSGLYVMYLYNRTTSKDGSATCRTVSVGSQLYVGDESFVHILQVSWHSHSDTHLAVLSSDSVFRLFDLSSDVGNAEQEFYLQPGEQGRCHDAVSICPVAFSFGGEHLWERFSVFLLFSDGSIYILCPVVPFGSFYAAAAVDELYKDAHNLGLNSSNPQAVNNSSLAISWLEAAFPEVADQAREGSKSLVLKARPDMSLHACLLLQGPLRRVNHHVECKGRAVSFLFKTISKDSVLVIAWSTGQLQIDALADETVPLWDSSTSPRVRVDSSGNIAGVAMICEPVLHEISSTYDLQTSENLDTVWLGTPPLLWLGVVDLALPKSGVTIGSLLMFSDPLFSEKLYCLHVGGVDLLSLHFLPFSSQTNGKDEYANAANSVVPVLTAGCNDSCVQLPLYAFVTIENSYGSSWVVGVTSSRECIVLETRGWDTAQVLQLDGMQKSDRALVDLETEPPNLISKELLRGPRSVVSPNLSSVATPDSISGQAILLNYFNLFREHYVEYAFKVYIELKDHADHLKEIIADGHKRLTDVDRKLVHAEEKQAKLAERIKRVYQFQEKLEKRLQTFQSLPGAKKKPLTKAEREFKDQLDRYKELELDAFSSTISTLNARLRRYNTQFSPSKSGVNPTRVPGRRSNLLENQMKQLKSSMERLSIVNGENSKKVKLLESALASADITN